MGGIGAIREGQRHFGLGSKFACFLIRIASLTKSSTEIFA